MGDVFQGSAFRALPPGGTVGQVLTKTSNAPYAAAWENASTVTPGGSSGSVQVNIGGNLFGDAYFFYNAAAKLFGVQQSTPIAPLHVTGQFGQTVAAPATLSVGLQLDSVVPTPTSASASQINGPVPPSGNSFSINYIDQPYDGGSFSQSENNGTGSGFLCAGQTISGTIYCYKNTSGANGSRVINPNGWGFSVQDFVGDFSTLWQLDLSGWTTFFAFYDGFILTYSDPNTGQSYQQDIGGSTSVALDGTYYNDQFDTSNLTSQGYNWYTQLFAYENIGINTFQSQSNAGYTVTDGSYGANIYLILNNAIPAPSYLGQQYYNSISGQWYDLGTATSFNDWGQSGSGPWLTFDNYAFANFNTSVSDGSYNYSNQNDGSGSYTANGYSYNYYIYEYEPHPVTGQPYFTGGYSFTIYDNADGQPFYWDININAGGGTGRVVIVIGPNGTLGVDIGGLTDFQDYGSWGSPPAITPNLSGYTGLLRDFSLYGLNPSPSAKYSSAYFSYTFQDDNSQPYMIQHVVGAITAPEVKLLDKYDPTGAQYNVNSVTGNGAGTYVELPSTLDSNTTVTPNTIGFLANGSNLNITYGQYAEKVIGGVTVWSLEGPTASTIDPNDGQHYTINVNGSAVSGAGGYKYVRTGGIGGSGQFKATGSTSFNDNNTTSWPDSSTVTPTSGPTVAAIIERDMTGPTDLPALQVNNTNSYPYSFLDFNIQGTTQVRIGYNGNDGSFMVDGPNGANLDVGGWTNPTHTFFHAPSYNVPAACFNKAYHGFYCFNIRGSSSAYQFLMWADAQSNAIYLGNDYNNFPGGGIGILNIQPFSTGMAIRLVPNYAVTISTDSLQILSRDSSNNIWWGMSNAGRFFTGTTTYGNAWVTIGPSITGSNIAGIILQNSGGLCSSPSAGSIQHYDNGTGSGLWFTSNSLGTVQLVAAFGSSFANQVLFTDTNGNPQPTTAITNTSGFIQVHVQFEAKSGISIDNGQYITLGQATSGSQAQLWWNATQHAFQGAGSTVGSLTRCIFTQTATGVCANTSAATTISSTGAGTLTIASGDLTAGKHVRIKGRGFYSTTGSPTLRLQIFFGATSVLDTGAVSIVSGSNTKFKFEGEITCRTTGSSGTLFPEGELEILASTHTDYNMGGTSTVTVNTTTTQAITVVATWSTPSASNTISLTNLAVELLN